MRQQSDANHNGFSDSGEFGGDPIDSGKSARDWHKRTPPAYDFRQHNGHNPSRFARANLYAATIGEISIYPLGNLQPIRDTLALLSDIDRSGDAIPSSVIASRESGLSINLKKVSRFSALAVDTETKIHILGPSRAGNCFPARFLIGSHLKFPLGFFDQ